MATYTFNAIASGYASNAASTWSWHGTSGDPSDMVVKDSSAIHVAGSSYGNSSTDITSTNAHWWNAAYVHITAKDPFSPTSGFMVAFSTTRVDYTSGANAGSVFNSAYNNTYKITGVSINSGTGTSTNVNILPIIARANFNLRNTHWFMFTNTGAGKNTEFYRKSSDRKITLTMTTTTVAAPTITWPHAATTTSNRKTIHNAKPYLKISAPAHPYANITTANNSTTKFSWSHYQVRDGSEGIWTNFTNGGRCPFSLTAGNHTLQFRVIDSKSRVSATATAYVKYTAISNVSGIIYQSQMANLATYINHSRRWYGISTTDDATAPTQNQPIQRSNIASNYTTALNQVGSNGGNGATFDLSAPTLHSVIAESYYNTFITDLKKA